MGLIRLLISALLLYVGYRILKSLFSTKAGQEKSSNGAISTDTEQDPVCGVFVSKEDAVVGTLDGKRHYFCSMDCLEKFRERLDNKKN